MKLIKLILSIILSAVLLFAAQKLYIYKTEVAGDAYSNIIFTRLAVETQTYTRQIEYGLKNGKSLEHFYGVNSILNDVKRCYSYTNGVYIVSSDHRILYSVADADTSPPEHIRSVDDTNKAVTYLVYNDTENRRYLVSIPILGQNEVLDGYMVLSVDHASLENTLDESHCENLVQSTVVAVLVCLIGILLFIHLKFRKRLFFTGVGIVSAATVSGYIFIDGALSVYKLFVRMETIIVQSVSRIVMALQYDLDSVAEKGVSLSKIYDLNTFLLESCGQIPYLDMLIFDKNYHISAVISRSYISHQTLTHAADMGYALLLGAAAGLGVVVLGIVTDIIRELIRLNKFGGRSKSGRSENNGKLKSENT